MIDDGAGRRRVWLGALVVGSVFWLLMPAKLWRPGTLFTIRENIQIAEAQAWWQGRLDLPERKWDSALIDGRVYSHFPPMFSFIAAVVVPVFDGVPHWFIVLFIVLPVPLLAYVLFLRLTKSVSWAVILAVGMACGTSAFPVLDKTLRGCAPYYTNQMLATIGLLIMLIESFGRRRLWLCGAGLLLAGLSRQLTVVYAIPFFVLAWRPVGNTIGRRRYVSVFIIAAVFVAVPCTMNTLKFGHPLETGYMYIYNDRPADQFSRDAQAHGIFSPHYIPRNLYYANLGFPVVNQITWGEKEQTFLRPNHMGVGIWWTTPLLIFLFIDIRRIVADRMNRAWLTGAGVVFVALMLYHSTGFDQRGFNRYSMDYVPVLFALIAPRCMVGWRRWLSLVLIGWSVLYFVVLARLPYWGPF